MDSKNDSIQMAISVKEYPSIMEKSMVYRCYSIKTVMYKSEVPSIKEKKWVEKRVTIKITTFNIVLHSNMELNKVEKNCSMNRAIYDKLAIIQTVTDKTFKNSKTLLQLISIITL